MPVMLPNVCRYIGEGRFEVIVANWFLQVAFYIVYRHVYPVLRGDHMNGYVFQVVVRFYYPQHIPSVYYRQAKVEDDCCGFVLFCIVYPFVATHGYDRLIAFAVGEILYMFGKYRVVFNYQYELFAWFYLF